MALQRTLSFIGNASSFKLLPSLGGTFLTNRWTELHCRCHTFQPTKSRPKFFGEKKGPRMKPKGKFPPFHQHIWVFPKIGVPQNGWFIMETPIKMGWFGGPTIIFWKHPYIHFCAASFRAASFQNIPGKFWKKWPPQGHGLNLEFSFGRRSHEITVSLLMHFFQNSTTSSSTVRGH